MAKTGSNRDYKSGPKNNWRRSVWNEVLSRTNGREKTEFVLYLAGPQDLDREIAISKGVPAENLIGIDWDQRNVKGVTGKRGCAVAGDALDVLWSWPENRPVCAVLLDFCSGIEFNNAAIYDAFEKKSLRNAVVMVNFMRGRDPWSNPIRDIQRQAGLMNPLWCEDASGEMQIVADASHRGAQFLKFHAHQIWQMGRDFKRLTTGCMTTLRKMQGQGGLAFSNPETSGVEVPDDAEGQRELGVAISLIFARLMKPRFFSYKSGNLRFDSVVFQHHMRSELMEPFASMAHLAERSVVARVKAFKELSVVRRIGAMLAVRTMRKGQAGDAATP
jgi:hypothetical protein